MLKTRGKGSPTGLKEEIREQQRGKSRQLYSADDLTDHFKRLYMLANTLVEYSMLFEITYQSFIKIGYGLRNCILYFTKNCAKKKMNAV